MISFDVLNNPGNEEDYQALLFACSGTMHAKCKVEMAIIARRRNQGITRVGKMKELPLELEGSPVMSG